MSHDLIKTALNSKNHQFSSLENSVSLLTLLNEARDDQRRNCLSAFSGRLEVLASYIIKHDMTVSEAVEALRIEAERINNEAGEIH
jgi:hypothetical protein